MPQLVTPPKGGNLVSAQGIAGPPIVRGRPDIGEYSLTKGHHIYAKKAFEGHINYDPNKGFAISNEFMRNKGWNHHLMTAEQRKLYSELYKSARPNNLQEHTRIAISALKKGGATNPEAREITAQALLQLRRDGVKDPVKIPWYNK